MGTTMATARVELLMPPLPPRSPPASASLSRTVLSASGLANAGRATPRSMGHVALSGTGPSFSLMMVKYCEYATSPSTDRRMV